MNSQSIRAEQRFDVVIIGAGPAGAMLGAVLARHAVRVLLLDGGAHPRSQPFEESPTALTSLLLRMVGERYQVPEISLLASVSRSNRVLGGTFGAQDHIGYQYQRDGRGQDPYESAQVDTSGPLHTGIHLYRPDSDARLFYAAVAHGCTAWSNVQVESVTTGDAGVTLMTRRGEQILARYVVDTSGADSPVAREFGVRDEACRFTHRSRAVWNHFRNLAAASATTVTSPAHRTPRAWDAGTTLQVFDGGWLWVTPFGNHPASRNHVTSSGLVLDAAVHPASQDLAGESEMMRHLRRFPDMARQFQGSLPVRDWGITGTLQYSASRLVGDRWCLLGDGAGYVDPLFSRGFEQAVEAVDALAWRLLRAVRDDDFSAQRFRYLDRLQQGRLDRTDALVEAAYTSFSDPQLWGAVFRTWALGQELARRRLEEQLAAFRKDSHEDHLLVLEDPAAPGLDLAGTDAYRELLTVTGERLRAVADKTLTAEEAADELYQRLAQAGSEVATTVPVRRGARFSAAPAGRPPGRTRVVTAGAATLMRAGRDLVTGARTARRPATAKDMK